MTKQIFLVGGAVRDQMLQRPVHDKDWVVVGATTEDMLQENFQQVGKDFPVFLHPKTKEEYALARTERKSGKGYTGFVCEFSPNITLEQDLLRRDLTINAMALDENDNLIDPYGGKKDLDNRILRHVSPAFTEDPLRVLRVARFAARYHQYGFSIAPETLQLMSEISQSGELEHLAAERVWKETERSLLGNHPEIYFEVLKSCHGLAYWFKELDQLWGVPNPPIHHPEIDSGIHTLMVLEQAAKLSETLEVRFAALTHDLGKGITDPAIWPRHIAHEVRGVPLVEDLCERIRCPSKIKDIAKLVCELHIKVHTSFKLKPKTILALFNQLDVWRKPERFEYALLACEADAKGRTGFENKPYPQAQFLKQCYQAALKCDVKSIVEKGIKGPAIKAAIERERQTLIATVAKPGSTGASY